MAEKKAGIAGMADLSLVDQKSFEQQCAPGFERALEPRYQLAVEVTNIHDEVIIVGGQRIMLQVGDQALHLFQALLPRAACQVLDSCERKIHGVDPVAASAQENAVPARSAGHVQG